MENNLSTVETSETEQHDVQLTEIELERFGTPGTRNTAHADALKAGKTEAEATEIAGAKFTCQVPDLAGSNEEIVAGFVFCYGFENDTKPRANGDQWTAEEQFWLKCQKHLQDKLRADAKRPPSVKLTPEQKQMHYKLSKLTPEKQAEIMSLLTKMA